MHNSTVSINFALTKLIGNMTSIILTNSETRKLASRKAKVARLNEDLKAYFVTSGDMALPDIECTVIGYSAFDYIEVKDLADGEGRVYGFSANVDGIDYTVAYVEEDGEIWLTGWDELEDDLKYTRRRLNKAWRVFRAENPDLELEHDDED